MSYRWLMWINAESSNHPTNSFSLLQNTAFECRRCEATAVVSFCIHTPNASQQGNYCQAWQKGKRRRENRNRCSRIYLPKKQEKRRALYSMIKEIERGHHPISHPLHEAPSEAPARCGTIQCRWYGDQMACQPASRPGRPVAASATRSRLLKGDTIPINVFLSTLLRCLFNTAPGGFRAKTARVKLHFCGLKESCDKSLVQVMDSQGLAGRNGGRV